MAENNKFEGLDLGDTVIDSKFYKGEGKVVRIDDDAIVVRFDQYPDFLVEYPLDTYSDYLSKA